MIGRRDLLVGALLAGPVLTCRPVAASDVPAGLAALEQRHGGRLGVAIVDTATMAVTAHRGDERFALCSTFKFLAASCVLARVDRGVESLTRKITYTDRDLVPHAPVTSQHVGPNAGMTIGELCDAAITLSDNPAGNLMLDSFGGPAQLTTFPARPRRQCNPARSSRDRPERGRARRSP